MLRGLDSGGVEVYESVSVGNYEFLMTAEIILPEKNIFLSSRHELR